MDKVLAQGLTISGQTLKNPYLDPKLITVGDVINRVTSFLFPLASIVLFFIIIWGGYDLLLSRGEAEKISSARAKITAGIIGFILMVISYLIVRILQDVFGLGRGIV